MERRKFMVLLGGVLAGRPATAFAQERGRSYRVGCLSLGPRSSPPTVAFFGGVGKVGFVDGKNLWIDLHGFDLRFDQLSAHARELAKAEADVIYAASGDAAIRAAQDATRTIPILGVADDMVGSGLVQSLASPGGNTTASASYQPSWTESGRSCNWSWYREYLASRPSSTRQSKRRVKLKCRPRRHGRTASRSRYFGLSSRTRSHQP
jgi:hypothetical protein